MAAIAKKIRTKETGESQVRRSGIKDRRDRMPRRDRQVEVTADRCPDCGTELENPIRVESKVIEEIPEPPTIFVTEYKIAHYICLGNNTIAQTILLKYEDRLPHRKIQDALKRLHGLNISPATILDLTRRADDAVQSQYFVILNRIRDAPILCVDETSIKVQGELRWIWTFTTLSETVFVIRKSRGIYFENRKISLRRLRKRFLCIMRSKISLKK